MENTRIQLQDKSGDNKLFPNILADNIVVSDVKTDGIDASKVKVVDVTGGGTDGADSYTDLNTKLAALASQLGALTGFDVQIVPALPLAKDGKKGVIYLISHDHTDSASNVATATDTATEGSASEIYDEYIFIPSTEEGKDGTFEKIGNTDITLNTVTANTYDTDGTTVKTEGKDGLMSVADKEKVDALGNVANLTWVPADNA